MTTLFASLFALLLASGPPPLAATARALCPLLANTAVGGLAPCAALAKVGVAGDDKAVVLVVVPGGVRMGPVGTMHQLLAVRDDHGWSIAEWDATRVAWSDLVATRGHVAARARAADAGTDANAETAVLCETSPVARCLALVGARLRHGPLPRDAFPLVEWRGTQIALRWWEEAAPDYFSFDEARQMAIARPVPLTRLGR